MSGKFKSLWPVLLITATLLVAFYPVWFQGKIPLNGRNLAAFYSPWIYQKFPGFPTGIPSKPGMPDQLRLYYPYLHLTQQIYRRLELPLWNPHNFAGNPHMAEMQSGVFYPLHLFLPFLPLPIYWTLFQFLGFFLSGLFTYLYLRHLKLNQLPSVYGALTFMLSTFMFTWTQEVIIAPHSILWLPLILICIDKILARSSPKFWFLGLFSLSASILSGYWQTTFYVLLAAICYALFRSLQFKNLLGLVKIVSMFPLSLGLTAFQLLPTFELYNLSSRPIINTNTDLTQVFLEFLLKPFHLLLLLAPDLFGHPTTRNLFANPSANYYELSLFIGTIPMLFVLTSLLSIFSRTHHRPLILFFAALGIISASFAFDLPHSRLIYTAKIPLLSTGVANRVLFLQAFSFSILAAFGIHHWLKSRLNTTWISAFLITLTFALTWVFLYRTYQVHPENFVYPIDPKLAKYVWPYDQKLAWWQISMRNLIIPTMVWLIGLSLLLARKISQNFLFGTTILVLGLSFTQNLYQFFKFTPFSEPQFVYPPHPAIEFLQQHAGLNRYLGYHSPVLGSNFATFYGLYTIEGFDSLNEKNRSQLIFSATKVSQGKLDRIMPRSADAILNRDYTDTYPLRIMSLLGVKYLIDYPKDPLVGDTTQKPRLPPQEQTLVWQDGDWKIYEYIKALPRAFLASSYITEPNDQKTADLIFNPQTNLREQIILTQAPPFELADDPQETTEITDSRPTRIIINTKSSTNQLLFLSDTFYPGWHATVDGQTAPIYRADLAFRTVPVPAGLHTVTFTYFPDSFKAGLALSAATLIITLCVYRFWLKLA